MKRILLILLLLPGVASAEGIVNVTSTARDAFTTPLEIGGIYNRTINVLQWWDGSAWKSAIATDGTMSGATISNSTITLLTGTSPTTDVAGKIAFDTNAWASGRGAIQAYDGTANTYILAALASDTPSNGQVPKWNTGGTITWEDDTGGGAIDTTAVIGSKTWGDGSTDTIVWTFNRATGTDPTITFNSGSIGFQAITLGSALAVSSGGTGITSFGTGVADALGQNVSGSGSIALTTSPTFTTPTLGAATATTLDTGNGANELYAMDQNVRQADSPTFANVTVGSEAYSESGWNGDATAPQKDAVRDQFEKFHSSAAVIETHAAGTAYSLTSSAAALDFGTTDPAITITAAGTYRIEFCVNLEYADATDDAQKTVTVKLRRTNNTAADLTGGTVTMVTPEAFTSYDATMGIVTWSVIYTTANTDDALTIFGGLSGALDAGNLNATQAFIRATRIY